MFLIQAAWPIHIDTQCLHTWWPKKFHNFCAL